MATPATTLLNIKASPAAGQNFFNLDYARDTGSLISPTQAQTAVLDDAPYFTTAANGTALKMRVSTGAATTSGSDNPRCEFREQTQGGSDAAWNLFSNEHILSGRTRIVHQPSFKSSICIAQIHNAAGDVMELQTRGGTFYSRSANDWYVVLTVNGTVGSGPILLDHCADGTEIAWKIRVYGGGHYQIYVQDMVTPTVTDTTSGMASLSFAANASDSYFKVGCYVQANPSTPGYVADYGEIELRDLHCWHTGYTASQTLVFGTDTTAAISNVRWGTKSEAVNSAGTGQSLTPSLPAGLGVDDAVFVIARARRTSGSTTISTPLIASATYPGWKAIIDFGTAAGNTGTDLVSHSERLRVYHAAWYPGMVAPVVTVGGSTLTDISSAQMFAISGARLSEAEIIDQAPTGFNLSSSASTSVIGPTAALPANAMAGSLALALLAHEYNVTSGAVGVTSGDSLTWVEGGEGVQTTVSGQAWCNDYALVPTARSIAAKQATVTATSGKSASALLTLAPANRRASGLLMAA